MSNDAKEQLALIDPSQRVLLLSHCLRPSQTCPAKYNKQGLDCLDNCQENCVLGRLRRKALSLGYKGVCVAPGGRLAVRFIQESRPQGIVAIACNKELEEGISEVNKLALLLSKVPPIVVVPLLKDGCVDTEVDELQATEMLELGCTRKPVAPGQPRA